MMLIPKFLMIIIFIFSFLASTVSSKLISFCLTNHNSEQLNSKKFSHDHSCHSNAKEKKEKQICFDCNCYSNNILINISSSVISNNLFKSRVYEISIGQYSFTNSLIDPPPRKLS